MSDAPNKAYLTIGEGAISPAARVAKGELTEQAVDSFVEALKGDELFEAITEWSVPNKCVDGRPRADGQQELGPNAAGGTFSLVAADALTRGSFRRQGAKAPEHATAVYEHYYKLGYKIGGHDSDTAAGPKCGCGAADSLDSSAPSEPSILRYIARRGGDIRGVLASLGVEVGDDLHTTIVGNATTLHEEGYATTGADLKQSAVAVAGPESVETLSGSHGEVAVVINLEAGKTLNRQKAAGQFGPELQAFNVDVPSLQKAAELIALSPDEAHEKFIGALYYNIATAGVLADDSLRVVVREPKLALAA